MDGGTGGEGRERKKKEEWKEEDERGGKMNEGKIEKQYTFKSKNFNYLIWSPKAHLPDNLWYKTLNNFVPPCDIAYFIFYFALPMAVKM